MLMTSSGICMRLGHGASHKRLFSKKKLHKSCVCSSLDIILCITLSFNRPKVVTR